MVKLLIGFVILAGLLRSGSTKAQCPPDSALVNNITEIRYDTTISNIEKINQLHQLQNLSLNCNTLKDSVYARIVHRLGDFYNKTGDIEKAIHFTKEAITVNKSAGKNAEDSYLADSYFNLGLIYRDIYLPEDSRQYLDSCIFISTQYPHKYFIAFMAFAEKAFSFFHTGDYQKMIETADNGILLANKAGNVLALASLLAQKAQAQTELNYLPEAVQNIRKAIAIQENKITKNAIKETSKEAKDLALSYSVYARVLNKKGDNSTAIQWYTKAFELNKAAGNWGQCIREMMNLGDLYEVSLKDGQKAMACYKQGIELMDKAEDANMRAGFYINMGIVYWKYQHHYNQALQFFQKALLTLPIQFSDTVITSNPSEKMLQLASNDDYVLTLLSSKAETLLEQYKLEQKKTLLAAALQTFELADKAVDIMRRKQSGEQSKLFWREATNHLYGKAIEACFIANNSKLAFFFMEKSRAVLLNDKLNELGASAYLPDSEKIKEQEYRRKFLTEEQKWMSHDPSANAMQQVNLLKAKEEFEKYIQSLEKKYPVYYQYKYAQEVPSIQALQQYLARDKKSFVHYFLSDTMAYMLTITPSHVDFKRVTAPVFNYGQISEFLNYCADKQKLNNDYSTFATLSNKVYTALFQPLHLTNEKVIICADNFLLPFEALCKDIQGKEFLMKEYVFSYVYSARNLLKNIPSSPAKGNFIGFAPGSFQPYLGVSDLKQSTGSLKEVAKQYRNTQLFTGELATKNNFIHHITPYRVVNIFSHASADTTFSEPLLFMYDSVIHLSELQLLPGHATQLVILSACETNVGKHANGEGIYSLARGFASAGIPAVAATLWKADEQAIYSISKTFNQYLSEGFSKDEALQKAKLDFIDTNPLEKSLPYFWASMIIIGDTAPVEFTKDLTNWWWMGGLIVTLLILTIFLLRKKKFRRFSSSQTGP